MHPARPRCLPWLALLLAGCSLAPATRDAAVDPGTESGYAPASESTRGLVAANPSAGAFFDDGADGDVRGRAENRFDAPPAAQRAGRSMIRTAELTIEVPRAEDAVARCGELAEEHAGYVSRRDGDQLVCRVPAAQFEDFVDEIRSMGRVLHESMQALDVTEQHRDLTIRLDNARKSRDRLLALLEKAEAVEDLLKIENELRRLTEEIERMTAELKALEDQVAMSTVTVAFQGTTPDRPQPQRRRPSRFPWINAIGAENVLRSF